ncbi:uncharacterized protein LOC116924993 [Daphnia magna]|uniref:uncharacterized protein LOC116924993 n=1 Tax=Daphnia magna TaxID=35525 RepID=UPI001E1BC1DE|nr:uncharacterized protein LOC116924993 [Daphnia magna]
MWSTPHRSWIAEVIYGYLDCQLKTPCATRWNSEFDAVECILQQDQALLKTVMKKLKIEVLDESDLTLLKEYLAIMGPLAKYLDVLQSENNNYLGCVIPCLQKIKSGMTECKDLAPNGYGVAISRGLLGHIERRFKPLVERDSLMIATTVHPRFKLNWIAKENEMLARKVRILIEAGLENLDLHGDTAHCENMEDPLQMPSRATSIMNELDLFLVDNDRSLSSLNKYPRIKDLFLRYNTGLPSSAPVERLFSAGPLVLTIRRNRLSDELFETLLILKVHKRL